MFLLERERGRERAACSVALETHLYQSDYESFGSLGITLGVDSLFVAEFPMYASLSSIIVIQLLSVIVIIIVNHHHHAYASGSGPNLNRPQDNTDCFLKFKRFCNLISKNTTT